MAARILLVDDHALVREGIKQLLVDYSVCGEASDGLEAIQKVLELKPDLVLMDISMPNMNGIEATKQIRKQAPEIKIILLSMHDSVQIAEQGKQAGADAYVVKASSAAELQKTIKSVMNIP